MCTDQWDKQDAEVACRMMGFSGSVAVFYGDKQNNETANSTAWLNNMQCNGSESSLFSCQHGGFGFHVCKAIAGVLCSSDGKKVAVTDETIFPFLYTHILSITTSGASAK